MKYMFHYKKQTSPLKIENLMKKRSVVIILLLALLIAACSPKPSTSSTSGGKQQGAGSAKETFTDLNREKFSSYLSRFRVQFDGDASWGYQLQTRKSPTLREINLHIEGIEKSANPGDVRMVTDGKTSWMIGPGTDNECVQFPNGQGMDPTLIYPEMLLPGDSLAGLLKLAGNEPIGGIASQHYTGSAPTAGNWKDVSVEVWQDPGSRGLLRFTMQASGTDPFFGKGAGKLTAYYEAGALDVAAIEPVKGCEISVPLPDPVEMYVRLPGMASFESNSGLEQMQSFYQTELPKANWTEKEPPAQSEGVTILSYQRNYESVEIHIEALTDGGSKVKLLFILGQ